ncbi:MAG: DUF4032 domain-containing protein [Myxococcales bacterium]|nr:DUF4032 domain-containing protein [Myxococcales bacterium]
MHGGFRGASVRPGHPDFLDLPWSDPFDQWPELTPRVEDLPRGESRNPVVFVAYEGRPYALKALEPGRAELEYAALRAMEAKKLPVVSAVGHLARTVDGRDESVLITRFLDHSMPYRALFTERGLGRYREHLLDALAGLLVQLHVAGVFWGDCSLSNTLFLRDAGTLNAYLVDAETSSVDESVSDQRRKTELELMEENVAGALFDLIAQGSLPSDFSVAATVWSIRERYEALWTEIQREEVLLRGDHFAIEERIRRLNALGFSVGEIELEEAGHGVRLRAIVTDRTFHRDLLHSLTGLVVQERQAQLMVNEIRQIRASLSTAQNRSMSLSAAAYHWSERVFAPSVLRIRACVHVDEVDDAERYCQLLEHKWYLSEKARRDVGLEVALDDYLRTLGSADAATTSAG